MADEERIKITLIVFLQHVKIRRDDEGRTVPAGRHQQKALLAEFRFGKGLAVDATNAHRRPVGDLLALVGTFQRTGDSRRHIDFKTPAAALLPTVIDQIVGDGGQDIRLGIPDVGAAVAVEIDRMFQERGRQELRLAEGARP
jgi:hypothetical protein